VWLDGVPRPDHGPGFRTRRCASCGAGWVGHERDGDWCPWCEAAEQRQRADERRLLLDPPWLRRDQGRYDALGPDDRAVWDRTRGQARGAHSVEAWVARLARAVEAGLIDEAEAIRAIRRMRG
jgi:hypothetical protein